MQKLQSLDLLTGDEYICGDIEGYVKDINYYLDNAEETPNFIQYNQLEFAKKYARTYCTLYGPMCALATKAQRDFTPLEREELMKLRKAESDFHEDKGGMTSRGIDVVRRWWNTRFPQNPVVSMIVDNNSETRKKLFARNIPLVTSFRGNATWSADIVDGVVNGKTFGTTTYGHCRSMMGLTVYDNYKTTNGWKRYSYPSIDHYLEVLKNGYERPQSFVFFLENELSQDGKRLVQACKLGLWNGERENDLLTRYEASRIALRLSPKKIEEEKVWNGKNGDSPASRYEYTTMLHRVLPKIKVTSDVNRNQNLTRREAILMIV